MTWPNGAKVALNFVLNYEEGGENCLLHGDGESEKLLSEIVGAGAIGKLMFCLGVSLYVVLDRLFLVVVENALDIIMCHFQFFFSVSINSSDKISWSKTCQHGKSLRLWCSSWFLEIA